MKRITFKVPKSGVFSPLTADSLASAFQTQDVPKELADQKSELDREIEKALGSLNLDTYIHVNPQGREIVSSDAEPRNITAQVIPPTPIPDNPTSLPGSNTYAPNARSNNKEPLPSLGEDETDPNLPPGKVTKQIVYAAPAPPPQNAKIAGSNAHPLGLPAPKEDVDEHIVYYQQRNLVGAIFRGDLTELRKMLESGVSPNQFDDAKTFSALHFAVHRNMYLFAEELLNAGADPNIRGHDLQVPIHCAHSLAMGALLHKKGALLSVQNNLGQEPIHTLSERGCTTLVDYLVSHGVSINAVDAHGKTALHWAAWGGRVQTLEWLFRNGCDMWIMDQEEAYPIHWACVKGHFDIVRTIKRLVKPVAFYEQVSAKMSENRTPSYLANYHLNKLNMRIIMTLRENARRKRDSIEGEGRVFTPNEAEGVLLSIPETISPEESEFYMADIGMTRDESRLRYFAVLRELSASEKSMVRRRACCGVFASVSDFCSSNLRDTPVIITGLWMLLTYLSVAFTDLQCQGIERTTWFAHSLFTVFVMGCFYFWYTTVWGEPGALSPTAQPIPGYPEYAELHMDYVRLLKDGTLDDSQACSTCRIIKPLRSKHCSICGHCVLKFDHHCPFLDVDIGAGNYHSFIFFLITAMLGGIAASYIIIYSLVSTEGLVGEGTGTCLGKRYGPFGYAPLIIPLTHIFGFIATGMLIFQHGPLICDNFTTNERVNINKYKHFWSSGYIVNPFDLGNILNIASFFGCLTEPILNSLGEAKKKGEANLKRWRSKRVETCHGHSHGSADADIQSIHDVNAESI